jgi:hypothetical protein
MLDELPPYLSTYTERDGEDITRAQLCAAPQCQILTVPAFRVQNLLGREPVLCINFRSIHDTGLIESGKVPVLSQPPRPDVG